MIRTVVTSELIALAWTPACAGPPRSDHSRHSIAVDLLGFRAGSLAPRTTAEPARGQSW